ncbi:MerR family transcriptional regulator [Actibacterium lipolyticum]|uniref:MerR family regulatory protein n=1 Tax=Actibacterium lipolyticum TaxID=1524263 RepID=A0A238KI85_9RHOB|nr:MerR family transcriptional regulator [Actibacterium lipolyticum]SMX41762.1 MerR family regulatory protein [Actibacterium lipolyticum]
MEKSRDAFRTISEVSEWLDTPAHVLRFWESRFTQIKPVKRAGGRRYYRPADMELLGGIKKLLHDDGLTIRGVQKILREQGVKYVSTLSQPLEENAAAPKIVEHTEEAPMVENVVDEPPIDNVFSITGEAAANSVEEPVKAEVSEPQPQDIEPEAESVAAPVAETPSHVSKVEVPPTAPAPLGTDLPTEDPSDDEFERPSYVLTARLRDRDVRRHMRETQGVALREAVTRLTQLRDRISNRG